MVFLISLLVIAIIIGSLRGGKSFGETINKGCGTIITIILIIVFLVFVALAASS